MKKVILIVLACLALIPTANAVNQSSNIAGKKTDIFLTIVIDSGPMFESNWKLLKILAKEAVAKLEPKDQLRIIAARSGKPVLLVKGTIESKDPAFYKEINRCIDNLGQVFFLGNANVVKAVELAFEELNQPDKERYQACLLVLSDGKMSDNQVKHIRRLSTAHHSKNCPVLFTSAQSGSKKLFMAGAQGEIAVSLINQVNLHKWFQKVRTISEPIANQGPVLPKVQIDVDRLADAITTSSKFHRDKPEQMPPNKTKALKKTKGLKLPKNFWSTVLGIGGIIAAIAVLYIAYILLKPIIGSKSLPDAVIGAPLEDCPQYHIMAQSNGETFDFGDEQSINSLIIGKNPGSAIPITDDSDDDIEFEHAKISQRNGKFKIKNTSSMPIFVNGIAVNRKQKQELFFPSTIQLTENFKIDLYRQIPESDDQELITDDNEGL